MVISTLWSVVVPYQNILITGSKTMQITTERKYLSVFFVLRQAEKVDQKNITIVKKQCTLKSRAKMKNEIKVAQRKWSARRTRLFISAIIQYFLRSWFKYFKKFPCNAEIRYWVIQEMRLLKFLHIEIKLSVNGYALFGSLFLNVFLNQIREQENTTFKC